jgi:hypothetical protein
MAEGAAWAEVPPSLTQRLVTNVLVDSAPDIDGPGALPGRLNLVRDLVRQ